MADPHIITDHTGRDIMLGGSAKTPTILLPLSQLLGSELSEDAHDAIREAADSYGKPNG